MCYNFVVTAIFSVHEHTRNIKNIRQENVVLPRLRSQNWQSIESFLLFLDANYQETTQATILISVIF